jgi:hypothetical protein
MTTDIFSQHFLNLKKSYLKHAALGGNLNCAYNSMNNIEPASASEGEKILTLRFYDKNS